MTDPIVQGWCPGAYKPMMSGDGLVVRIRPMAAEISSNQALGIAQASEEFGIGFIDLTNRANLQIRGVTDEMYPKLMERLAALELLDSDPLIEPKRNIVLTPFYKAGDISHRLYSALVERLPDFPTFPGKFGFAIDCGAVRILTGVPADIRFERSASGGVMIRAEGAETGFAVSEDTAVDQALELARWFMTTRPNSIRRMGKLLANVALPVGFLGTMGAATADMSAPGQVTGGMAYAAPFGPLSASSLRQLVKNSNADNLRITPWHALWLVGADQIETDLIASPDNPLLKVHACAGKPYCPQASVETRALAQELAGRWPGRLHISGCAKGCAYPHLADLTFVGQNGRFNLVTDGAAWDEPRQTALCPEDIQQLDLT